MEIVEHYSAAELQGLDILNPAGRTPTGATRVWVPQQPFGIGGRSRHPIPVESAASTPAPAPARIVQAPRGRITRNLWKPPQPATPVPPRQRRPLRRKRPDLPESGSFLESVFDGIRYAFGRSTLHRHAVAVREIVLSEPDALGAVRRFAREDLRIRDVTLNVLDALVDVLLSDDWLTHSWSDDQLQAHLRARTKERHRAYRPILESQMNRATIKSLSAVGAGQVPLDQLIPGAADTAEEALAVGVWEDARLIQLLGKLGAEERAVVEMLARFDRLSWTEAAALAGLEPRRGEQTRRRLRYLAREIDRRVRLRGAGGRA